MDLFYTEVNIPRWISRVDFDRRQVNKAIAKEAREIRKIARRLISRRAISNPGEFPGRQTGALWRSVTVLMNRRYSFAVIRPKKTPEMGTFHPYMLLRGTKSHIGKLAAGTGKGKSNRRARGDRVAAQSARAASEKYIIEARDNYMTAAGNMRKYAAREAISKAVQESLVPRK